jgi:hypothetical protein
MGGRSWKRTVFQWRSDDPSYVTTVEIDLVQVTDGTVVRLREHGCRATPGGLKALVSCATRWGEALTLVKFYLEHGIRY